MQKKTKIWIGVGVAAFFVVGGIGAAMEEAPVEETVSAPAPEVTVTETEKPSPSPKPEKPELTAEEKDLLAYELVWSQTSKSDKKAICFIFTVNPDKAFKAFNSGAGGGESRENFDTFFSSKC